jgi:hypothetical protein
MSVTINGTSGVTFNDASSQNTAATGFGFKNRIINGAMGISQRSTASFTQTTAVQYTLDRWFAYGSVASKFTVQQNAGSVTPPAGFINYLGVTSSSAYSISSTDLFQIVQRVEGLNVSDFAWGTASAASVTLSFWVRSSLTGTFGGSIGNSAYTRSYPFSYTISSANTWEQKSVTIAGDTSGTWLTTNGVGLYISIGLGVGSTYSGTAGAWAGTEYASATGATSVVGTNGATFYITGVQLEKGSTATSFDYRPYGTELQLAQRYYFRLVSEASFGRFGIANNLSTTIATAIIPYPVTMRVIPSALEQSGTAADYTILGTTSNTCTSVPVISTSGTNTTYGTVNFTTTGLTAGQASQCSSSSGVSTAFLGWSAEL